MGVLVPEDCFDCPGAVCVAETAKAIQLRIEYNPHPPFDAGSPARAGSALVAQVSETVSDMQTKRLEATKRASIRLDPQKS